MLGAHVAHRAAEQTKSTTEQSHVAEIEARLEQSIHFGFEEVVVGGVDVNVARGGGGGEEGGPVPAVVFSVEEEVSGYDSHADNDHKQQQHHKQHEPVHVVDLVRPERGEDEVHFNEDGAEGENTSQGHDHPWLHEPLLLGYGPRHGIHTTRRVGLP